MVKKNKHQYIVILLLSIVILILLRHEIYWTYKKYQIVKNASYFSLHFDTPSCDDLRGQEEVLGTEVFVERWTNECSPEIDIAKEKAKRFNDFIWKHNDISCEDLKEGNIFPLEFFHYVGGEWDMKLQYSRKGSAYECKNDPYELDVDNDCSPCEM